MHIALVTDAWTPQVNGVVRTLQQMCLYAAQFGFEIVPVTPADYRTVPCPSYPEIRLAVTTPWRVSRRLDEINPDHVHIATEGPLGWMARRWCRKHGRIFTTSYHTHFPAYVSTRFGIPESWVMTPLRWFHGAADICMVATESLEQELRENGIERFGRWSRGVDTERFHPRGRSDLDMPGPVFLYVGRVAVEKNLDAFLALDLPGTKVIVGDGPARRPLGAKFPDAVFLGVKEGEELATVYAAADVFVFPSRTDTFGIVLLEALASGLPVAAYPVPGPKDVIGDSGTGVLDEDLRKAALAALEISPEKCRAYAETFSWQASAAAFFGNVRAAHGEDWPAAKGAAISR